MRVIFMGTPDFSVGALKAILEAGHEVLAVVSQPDKPKGRGKELQMPPVKEYALTKGLTVYQPAKVREPEFVEILRALNPDVMVVVAFGQLLPKSVLDIPKHGCINIHASLLPKYRGAAPIQWAVIDGEEESGVTIQQMDEGLDTGDILKMGRLQLDAKETGGSLFHKLELMGAKLICETLDEVEAGTVVAVKQEGESTYAGKLDKQTGKLDFTRPAKELECLIRGLNPWPSAYTTLGNKTMKIWDAEVVEESFEPGVIYRIEKKYFYIGTGAGALKVLELQLEGKKRMDTEAFLRGYELTEGQKLGL